MANQPAPSQPPTDVDPVLREEFCRLMDGYALQAGDTGDSAQHLRRQQSIQRSRRASAAVKAAPVLEAPEPRFKAPSLPIEAFRSVIDKPVSRRSVPAIPLRNRPEPRIRVVDSRKDTRQEVLARGGDELPPRLFETLCMTPSTHPS